MDATSVPPATRASVSAHPEAGRDEVSPRNRMASAELDERGGAAWSFRNRRLSRVVVGGDQHGWPAHTARINIHASVSATGIARQICRQAATSQVEPGWLFWVEGSVSRWSVLYSSWHRHRSCQRRASKRWMEAFTWFCSGMIARRCTTS